MGTKVMFKGVGGWCREGTQVTGKKDSRTVAGFIGMGLDTEGGKAFNSNFLTRDDGWVMWRWWGFSFWTTHFLWTGGDGGFIWLFDVG